MNPDEEIFETAAEVPDTERAAYLDKACAGQPELRARIEALLRADEATGFMDDCGGGFQPPLAPNDTLQFPASPAEQPGERIGRYRLLQQIGEGGFGTVWMAEQMEPVTRRVALKIIKAGMDTKEVIARFEAERQALAMMDHPNIARVLDAGATDKGRPFFVMELVKGIPITKFCDEQQFTTRQRLELFGDVCSAINHAHQKGVIHRDIKPSNVMVTLNADRPVVKVIDFGIAKATQGKLTDRTLFTRFEQFIGTPAYMSPEQAAISEVDIDTRSDIYSLGVLLYELLTGQPPFDAKSLLSAGYEEMRRIIREVEPPRPSTRLMQLSAASNRTDSATKSKISHHKSRIPSDLDWIAMKAIEKDRNRRYETANGLGLDIRRFLSDEPVSAGPPTTAYRFHKFARRHRAALRAGIAVAALLTVAAVAGTWLAIRATNAEVLAKKKADDEAAARTEAESARNEAQILSDFLLDTFSRPQAMRAGPGLTVVQAAEDGLKRIRTQLATEPLQRHQLQRRLAWLMYENGKTKEALPYVEESRDYYLATHPPDHIDTINVQRELATYYVSLGRFEEAKAILEPAYKIAKPIFTPEHKQATATSLIMTHLASAYYGLGEKKKAREMREELLDFSLRRPAGVNPVNVVWAREALAQSYFEEKLWTEALKLREEALPYRYKTHSATNPGPLFALLEDLAENYILLGRDEDAKRTRQEIQRLREEEIVAAGKPKSQSPYETARLSIVQALRAGRFDEAIEACRSWDPVKAGSENLAEPRAWLVNALLLYAGSEEAKQNPDKAEGAAREAAELLALMQSRKPDFPPAMAGMDLFIEFGHWNQAAAMARTLHEHYGKSFWVAYRLAPLLVKTGDHDAYRQLCDEILRNWIAAPPDELKVIWDDARTDPGHMCDVLARVLCLRAPSPEHLSLAIKFADLAIAKTENPFHRWFILARALAAYRAGEFRTAVSMLEPALARMKAVPAIVASRAVLAMAKHGEGDREAARHELRRAEELHRIHWAPERRPVILVSASAPSHDWLFADVLLSEAHSLIGSAE
jgi:tetratricopeptide (TPR) repeat protein